MSRKFEIIDFRVKKFEYCFSDFHAPQIKIKGRGWYYIFLSDENNWLLLNGDGIYQTLIIKILFLVLKVMLKNTKIQ